MPAMASVLRLGFGAGGESMDAAPFHFLVAELLTQFLATLRALDRDFNVVSGPRPIGRIPFLRTIPESLL